ncbi:MAG: hypothetical protein KJO40_12020 [Deltaproteobacteria bacterium]|nr:hypothetical protein [Deltaproteobacteria bacterium]NND29212.1 hypothetical protein [Myxococcales bacterium]MBT8463420.1 hypothetical protein [Deltaproteobacteria bacterium]MBT8482217.1 hypothetical protein [Deltaproteobacteria bacterium]NNK06428.1 hypothetical protein [Myxococcales bacterium]
MLNRSGTRTVLAGVLVSIMGLAFLVVGCGSTGGGVGGALTRVIGQALAPETDGNQQNAVPLGDGTVVLLQYDDDGNLENPIMVGGTDADGNFVVDVQAQAVVAIIVQGTTNDGDVEISGLYNPDRPTIEKDLDPATSIACVAGISAIEDDSITEDQLDQGRVLNLEDAAAQYIAANPEFDFYDPANVDTAVAAVRSATNDGANPAAPGAFT